MPPDPLLRFSHPGNNELFTYLKQSARPILATDSAYSEDGYHTRARPELGDYLYKLIDNDPVVKGTAYGAPVLANPQGLVFAWAGGTHYIFIRLAREHHDAARSDNGRLDPTYGNDWVEFRIGGLFGGPADWYASMKRWSLVSYRDSLRESRPTRYG